MEINLVHFSDLHISKVQDSAIFSLNDIDNNNDNYVAIKNAIIKELEKLENVYLIFSGDITDTADKDEYISASKFINDLGIDKNRIFIIPGNHDINEKDNTKAWAIDVGNDGIKKKFEFVEKYNEFNNFYTGLFQNKTFNYEKIIIDYIVNDDLKIIIYFINSCSKCFAVDKNYDGQGYIDTEQLQKEYDDLTKHNYSDYSKFICFHQNILVNYAENTNSGFENQNKKNIETFLINNQFTAVINGHEHTGISLNIEEILHLNVNSLFKNNLKINGFNIYNLKSTDNSLILETITKILHLNKETKWSNTIFSEIKTDAKLIRKVNATESNNMISDSKEKSPKSKVVERIEFKNKSKVFNELSPYSEKLLEYVKELNIVKTGHFHWSNNSRAHNWIDIPQLLNKKKYLDNIQNWILNIKNENHIKPDLIIALGLEGNIISAKIAFSDDVPFSYLPYSYRYDDHTKLEKELKIEDVLIENIKNVLIITDVVHDGTTIKKIGQNKNENECVKKLHDSKNIEKIYIISMFYTGSNFERFCLNNKDENGNYENEKYELYPISKINIISCPFENDDNGGNFWKTDCDIYCQKLDKIYKFYNE